MVGMDFAHSAPLFCALLFKQKGNSAFAPLREPVLAQVYLRIIAYIQALAKAAHISVITYNG